MSGRIGKTKVRRPRLLSLCSGIGGIDLAAEMAGWEIAGQCEIDDYCQRVLARHWPDVKRVSDIRNVWGDSYDGAIDCIAAGFPCPPVSVAGKRRGAYRRGDPAGLVVVRGLRSSQQVDAVGRMFYTREEWGIDMTPSQRAFLDAQLALSAWRAAKDAEAQVAHWLTEGRASRDELAEFRARSTLAHQAHQRAQRAYRRACGLVG